MKKNKREVIESKIKIAKNKVKKLQEKLKEETKIYFKYKSIIFFASSKPGRYNSRSECQAASGGIRTTSKPRKSIYGLRKAINRKLNE